MKYQPSTSNYDMSIKIILTLVGLLSSVSFGVTGYFATQQTALASQQIVLQDKIASVSSLESGTSATVIAINTQLKDVKDMQVQTNKKLDCIISSQTCIR